MELLRCEPLQYKNGRLCTINEVISAEIPLSFTYVCTHQKSAGQEHLWQGEGQLYAYPESLPELVLGHVILDQLPCYDASFTYAIHAEEATSMPHFTVNLVAKDVFSPVIEPIRATLPLHRAVQIMGEVLNAQGKWDGTGCFHRAVLYHPVTGHMLMAEDIGRHNCVDRLKGHTLMHGIDIREYFLFITARITSSLYAKIRRSGISTIISRSAITSTAYARAQAEQCTLAAFCRPEGERITLFVNGMQTLCE